MASKKLRDQPGKKETLASKQLARVHRLKRFRGRLVAFSPKGWVKIGEILGEVGLLLIVFWLLRSFFGHEDQINVFSAPVVPVLATLIEKFVPYFYGVRIWLTIFLIFFPLSFYWFVKEISGRKLVGFLSSLVVIMPLGIFLPSRVNFGLLGGDGAHIASLTFMPLVCLLMLRFLRRGHFLSATFSALGTALVALTSPLGLVVLGVFMGVVVFSEMLLGRGRLKFIRFLIVLVLAAGFSSFWYSPKFVFLTLQSPQGQLIKRTFFNLLPISFFLLPLLGAFGFLLFENRPQLQPTFIAFFLTVGFGLFSLGAGIANPSPSRFLPAFGISLAFLIGVFIIWFFDFLRISPKLKRVKMIAPFRRRLAYGLVGMFLVMIFLITFLFGRDFGIKEGGLVLGITAEQKVGIWEIREKTSQTERIFGLVITILTSSTVVIVKKKLKESPVV